MTIAATIPAPQERRSDPESIDPRQRACLEEQLQRELTQLESWQAQTLDGNRRDLSLLPVYREMIHARQQLLQQLQSQRLDTRYAPHQP